MACSRRSSQRSSPTSTAPLKRRRGLHVGDEPEPRSRSTARAARRKIKSYGRLRYRIAYLTARGGTSKSSALTTRPATMATSICLGDLFHDARFIVSV